MIPTEIISGVLELIGDLVDDETIDTSKPTASECRRVWFESYLFFLNHTNDADRSVELADMTMEGFKKRFS